MKNDGKGESILKFQVLVDSFEKIERFVKVTNSSNYDIDLVSGRDVYLDAKSIMGILSCNIQKPMTVIVNCKDEEENQRIKAGLAEYIIA